MDISLAEGNRFTILLPKCLGLIATGAAPWGRFGWVSLGAPSFWREIKPHVTMELSDEFILELTQAQQRLFGYIFRRVANRDQAMEVLQQTNLVLCRKADDFELGTNFAAWSSTVAHYQILSYRKSLSRDRLVFTDEVSRHLAIEGWKQALELSQEKGMAPVLAQEHTITPKMLRERPQLAKDGYEVGDQVPGRILHARYSQYMAQVAELEPELSRG